MNYFEFYDLPIKFSIDKDLLRQKFLELSKQYHPDFFVNESDEMRDKVLEQSTYNNNAYKTLSNDNFRMKYILEISNTLTDADKEILPQDFLMEMMELNEEIMEMDPNTFKGIKTKVSVIENELNQSLKQHCDMFDLNGDNALLSQIKTIYLKQKYLLRIKESMLKFASL